MYIDPLWEFGIPSFGERLMFEYRYEFHLFVNFKVISFLCVKMTKILVLDFHGINLLFVTYTFLYYQSFQLFEYY